MSSLKEPVNGKCVLGINYLDTSGRRGVVVEIFHILNTSKFVHVLGVLGRFSVTGTQGSYPNCFYKVLHQLLL